MRPLRIPKNMNDMSQIKIFPNDRASWMSWSQEIEKFLQPYTKTSNFPLDKLGPCGISPYGYNESMICIYLKLNKIYGVENSPCNLTELDSKSHESERMKNPCSEIPLGLQEVIKNTNDPNQVWIECHGKTEKTGKNDTAAMGELEYFPSSQGFHSRHYPYLNQKGYVSPLVAVQIRPRKNIESTIQCRAWAQNIVYSQKYKLGYVEFSVLLVDDDHDDNKDKN